MSLYEALSRMNPLEILGLYMTPDASKDQMSRWDSTYSTNQDFFGKDASQLGLSALPVFQSHKARKILELGCGQGRDTLFLARNGMEVTALDYSETGLCQIKDKAVTRGLDGSVVDGRGFVGGCGVVDDEFVVIRERVDNRDGEVAGIAFFAIGTLACEFDGRVFAGDRFGLPVGLVETFASAMQMMGAVVGGEAVVLAVQVEAPVGDAIGAASDDAAEIGAVALHVTIESVEAEGDVAGMAVSVGRFQRDEGCAVVHYRSGCAVLVAQREQGDDGIVGEFPE